MKWILILISIGLAYAIYTGNMGGAKNATKNYLEVQTGGKK